MRSFTVVLATLTLLVPATASAQTGPDNQPAKPYRIADNLYYVGASDIASYLITTPEGHILIDAGYDTTVPIIEANVATLGFKMGDVKILLNTQAHFDHAGGFARLKQRTAARLMISDADAPFVEHGGRGDFVLTDPGYRFAPVTVDRRLRDGDQVRLGGAVLTAHLTPGHTKGCTTWTFDAADRGRTYHVLVLGGLSILEGTRVSGMPTYPSIESDYERTYDVLRRMPVDIFLGAHRGYYDGAKKADALRARPDGPNPFVDPDGFRVFVAQAEKRFRDQLAREKRTAK